MEEILTEKEIDDLEHWSSKIYTKGGDYDPNIEKAYVKELLNKDSKILFTCREALSLQKTVTIQNEKIETLLKSIDKLKTQTHYHGGCELCHKASIC